MKSPVSQLTCAVAILAATLLCPPAVLGATKKPATIKDLEDQQIDVSPDPPKNVDSAKTMESYKRFLTNGLRETFSLFGVPIRLSMRGGSKNPYAPKGRRVE